MLAFDRVPEVEQHRDQHDRNRNPPGEEQNDDSRKERNTEHQVIVPFYAEPVLTADPEKLLHDFTDGSSQAGLVLLLFFHLGLDTDVFLLLIIAGGILLLLRTVRLSVLLQSDHRVEQIPVIFFQCFLRLFVADMRALSELFNLLEFIHDFLPFLCLP